MVDALGRVCALVALHPTGWTVGGDLAGTSVGSLTDALYGAWYTQPAAPPPASPCDPPVHRASLLGALRAAHALAGTASTGWVVMSSDPRGVVSAARGEQARILRPGEYAKPQRTGVPPAPGEQVDAVARLDHLDVDRAVWWAFTDSAPEPPIGRVYLNVRPGTAPRVVHEVTVALAGLAYQLKCPVFVAACERVDAVVLYHERGARDDVIAALGGRWSALGPLLDPAVPPLTCRVQPGLAWADDIGDGSSYGDNRCHVLAAAIHATATTWGALALRERLAVLIAALRDAGVDPQHPWMVGP